MSDAVNKEEEIVYDPLADSIICECGGHYKARRKFFEERHLETLKHQRYLTTLEYYNYLVKKSPELSRKKRSKRKYELEVDDDTPIEIIS